MSRVNKLIKSMNPMQQNEVTNRSRSTRRQLEIDLGNVFKDMVNVDAFTKAALKMGINLIEQFILPKITAKVPQVAIIIAALLDSLEASLTQ